MAKDFFSEVPDSEKFWLANGKVVGSLKQLYEVLKKLDEKIFCLHVNEEKNDFYNWVKDVFNDNNLADDLLWCTNKESMLFCLKTRLDQAERAELFAELPKGYGQEVHENKNPVRKKLSLDPKESAAIMKDLPRYYEEKKVSSNVKKLDRKPLVTKINLEKIRKNAKIKLLANAKHSRQQSSSKTETFNKVNAKKIKKDNVHGVMKKIKEVYGF
ncbi:MAG TPA: hypothetical protein VJH92_05115 [Candidatus Nanoarchaeia archaeon]|nr:hypothetical protein [Candidatus Nanoarchaeia archaeon]